MYICVNNSQTCSGLVSENVLSGYLCSEVTVKFVPENRNYRLITRLWSYTFNFHSNQVHVSSLRYNGSSLYHQVNKFQLFYSCLSVCAVQSETAVFDLFTQVCELSRAYIHIFTPFISLHSNRQRWRYTWSCVLCVRNLFLKISSCEYIPV